MSGTGFVAPADLPLSDEDVEQAVFACLFDFICMFICMAACLTFKRRRNPEVLDSSWFWLCSCFARLSRYKVLLLKPHLRDMLALARRRRAIQLFNYIQWFVGFSWFFFKIRCLISANDVTPEFCICACMEWYGLWFTVILLTKMRLIEIGRMWRNLHLLKAATKHREKAGILGLCGTGMMKSMREFGYFWQQLYLLT